jgi:hypothetical protein
MTTAKLPQNCAERLADIAEILAAGLMRLIARKSSSLCSPNGETSLDFTAHQSSHAGAPNIEGGPH